MKTASKLILVVLLIAMGAQTVSGWIDHFDVDTSGSYAYDTTWQWQTASSQLKNQNAPFLGAAYYTDETFGSGTYETTIVEDETGTISEFVYADQDATLGVPNSHGTHYEIYSYPANGYILFGKVIGGSATWLGEDDNITAGTHKITITWDKDTGQHKVYLDDNPTILNITDTSITDSGYIGVGSNRDHWVHFNYLSFTPAVAPTPTPTPTPTPAPTPAPNMCYNTTLTNNEEGNVPITLLYILTPLALGLSVFAVSAYDNRAYANIIIGGAGSSVIWFYLAANIITGNMFYVSDCCESVPRTCVFMDVPLFWLFILFGIIMTVYTLALAVEAIRERNIKDIGGEE